jgi:hypothetical protein
MDIKDKIQFIYKSILVVLFIIFLIILYQYSENGRYGYHKEIYDNYEDRYVVDTRTGTIYGVSLSNKEDNGLSYKMELQTGKVWFYPQKYFSKKHESPTTK